MVATESVAPVADVGTIEQHISWDALYDKLIANAPGSPSDGGTIGLIVKRPAENERQVVDDAKLSEEGGMEGSRWSIGNSPDRKDQVCVMSCEAIRVIANGNDPDAWALAGDQLFIDFDLSKENLCVDDRVVVGDLDSGVILQVTSKPHNGCSKFAERYGADALKIVNSPDGKRRRLRGIYFRVLRGGLISTGDSIHKLAPEADP